MIRAPRLAVYCRVSSEEQKSKKTIERQLANAAIELKRLQVLQGDGGKYELHARVPGAVSPQQAYFIDDGYNLEELRQETALAELLELISGGDIEAVYVDSPDRLFRSRKAEIRGKISDLFDEFDTKLLAPGGEVPAGVLRDIVSALGAEDKKQVTRKLHMGRVQHTRTYHSPPSGRCFYGYHWDSRKKLWSVVEDEARIIQWTVAMTAGRVCDGLPATMRLLVESNPDGVPDPQILEALDGHGVSLKPYYQRCKERYLVKNPEGLFHKDWLTNLFRDDRYSGKHSYFFKDTKHVGRRKVSASEKTIIEIDLPKIFLADEWEEAKAARQKRARMHSKNVKQPYLLEKLLFCAECGQPMACRSRHVRKYNRTTRAEKVYVSTYYVCKGIPTANRAACPARRCHNTRSLDPLVWEEVRQFILNPDFISRNHQVVHADLHRRSEITRLKDEVTDLGRKRDHLSVELQRLMGYLAKGTIAEIEFLKYKRGQDEHKAALEKSMVQLRRELKQLEKAQHESRRLDVCSLRERYSRRLSSLGFGEKQDLTRLVLKQATLQTDGALSMEFYEPA